MINLAGPSFDYGSVLFAVLQECEHRRRSFVDKDAGTELMAIANAKLAQIETSYREAGGTDGYWAELQREVLETAMPQYVRQAMEENRLERMHFLVWRGGDLIARFCFALLGLTIGGIIIALPFIPIFEDTFAFALALAAWFYPELRRVTMEYRHSRALNKLITEAEKYQKDARLHYVSAAQIDEAFSQLGNVRPIASVERKKLEK